MSNPFSVAAVATYPKGPAAGTDNVTSLANNAAKGLGAVGTAVTQYADDIVAPIRIKTGTGTSASGNCSLYLVVSEDGSIYSNGVDPDSTSTQAAALKTDFLVETISANSDATSYYFKGFSLQSRLGYMPSYWALVIYNQSGASFSVTAADHSAKHSLVSFA